MFAVVAALWGCDREPARAPAPAPPAVIFRSADGQTLTQDDLKNVTGKVNFEMIGGEDVSVAARQLHQQARAAGERGDYKEAIRLLEGASAAAPRWPYPVYDTAYTHLLQKDFEAARAWYRKTLELSPRGFFAATTALDILEREQKGEFFPGIYLAYVSLEWMETSERAQIVRQLTERQPGFAPGWKEYAVLCENDGDRLKAIEKGLAARPDAETKGALLINKALILNNQGDRDAAVRLLGELALDRGSTYWTEQMAKVVLGNIMGVGSKGK